MRVLRLALFCGVFAMLFGAIVVMAQPRLLTWVYRETSYRVALASALRHADTRSAEETVRLVADYVHQQIYQAGGAVIDTDSWTHLVRGIGWCDQKAWTIGTLLAIQGIDSRLVMLRHDNGASVHTVLEVRLGDTWRLLDASYDFMLVTPDGDLGTLEDLSNDMSLLTAQPFFQQLEPQGRAIVSGLYAQVSPLRHAPIRWGSILEARNASRGKRLAERLVDKLWKVVGRAWADPLQDLYLALQPEPPQIMGEEVILDLEKGVSPEQLTRARRLYYQARNYHLYQRYAKARMIYHEILARFPTSFYAQRSQLWLGRIAVKQGDPEEAIAVLTDYCHRWPESRWMGRAYDCLAVAYAQTREWSKASEFEKLALSDPMVTAAVRAASRFKLP